MYFQAIKPQNPYSLDIRYPLFYNFVKAYFSMNSEGFAKFYGIFKYGLKCLPRRFAMG
jgi:hypothetical protein